MVKILAHRGYLVNKVPENTIPSFKASIEHGADGIEFDIHLTSDNKLVCFHDDKLEKLGRKEKVKDLTEVELTNIELKEGIFIPTLSEIIEEFGNKVMINIEVKFRKNGSRELVDIINQYSLKKDPTNLIVSSFNHRPLQEIKTIDSEIPTALLFNFARGQLQIAKSLKCNGVNPFYNTIPEEYVFITPFISTILHKIYAHRLIKNAKEQELIIYPYDVNHEQYLQSAIKKGVDGIITDEVELALKIRKELKNE
jgi:glycerophosphoryl diester phosphodiesterase